MNVPVLSGAWRADGRLLNTAGAMSRTAQLGDVRGGKSRSRSLPGIPPNVP
jgi:hypothetical protein